MSEDMTPRRPLRPTDERYLAIRRDMEQFFIRDNLVAGAEERYESPCGRYTLEVDTYECPPSGWEFTRGVVRRVSDGALIADVKRNLSPFWHAWVDHADGNHYLLCGEDYQGYSVIDLGTGIHRCHFPEEGYKGAALCWAAVSPSPDGLVLAVDGCVWARDYELVLYDFSKPKRLPLLEIGRLTGLGRVFRWKGNDKLVIELWTNLREPERDTLTVEPATAVEQRLVARHFEEVPSPTEVVRWQRGTADGASSRQL